MAPRCSWVAETTAQSPSRCSDVLPPSRMSSVNNVLAQEPSLRPSSGRRARRRDPGKAKEWTVRGPSICPRESPTTGFDKVPHGQAIGTCKRCIWLHVASIRMSPWIHVLTLNKLPTVNQVFLWNTPKPVVHVCRTTKRWKESK